MSSAQDQHSMVKVIYILYLVAIVTGGLTAIVGVVLAYAHEGAADEPMRDHFRFQIRTFWMALLYSFVCGATTIFLVGILFWLLLVIWMAVRCGKGLSAIGNNQPPADITTWWM